MKGKTKDENPENLVVKKLSSASIEELEVELERVGKQRSDALRTERFILRELKRRHDREKKKRPRTISTVSEVGLPIPPVLTVNTEPVGDVNLLMTQVPLVLPPFDRIIIRLAKNLIERTSGQMPTIEVQSAAKKKDEEPLRLVARWKIPRAITQDELVGVRQIARDVYERELAESGQKWTAHVYQEVDGSYVPGKRAIYLGPSNFFSESSTGIIIARKFPTAAEAKFLSQTRPQDWIYSSATGQNKIETEVEMREGPKDDHDLGLSQENFLEAVVQISYLLEHKKLIQRRILMTSIFKELNRVGTRVIERERLFGMTSTLEIIERVLLFPFQQPDIARHLELDPESILLAGVPGVGKTLLAHYLMTGDYNVIFGSIDSNRLHQDLKQSGEKGLTPILLKIDCIREVSALPIVVLIDDIDVVAEDQDISSKFLNLMQGIREKGLYFLASTNKPEKIDERLLEPGRLSKVVHVPLPNLKDRAGVLRAHLKSRVFESQEIVEDIVKKMAQETQGWTQRYLWELCVEAARLCGLDIVNGNISAKETGELRPLNMGDFQKAKDDLSKRINLERLKKWDKEIGSFVSNMSRVIGFKK